MKRLGFIICLLLCLYGKPAAQEYAGITGMVHVPTAEMASAGEARIGAYFLNWHSLPEQIGKREYNTFNHFLALTPFSWLELSYVCTLLKRDKDADFNMKDRSFSAKVRPLKEGKWWPSVAIGMQDIGHTPTNSKLGVDGAYFQNIFLALTKHLRWKRHELGIHLAYRYYTSDYNAKWRGIAGGVSYRPAFARNLRAMVEYTGSDVNIGVDCQLWRHLFLQASLLDGKHFSGGVSFKINLLGGNRQWREHLPQ